MANPNIPPAPAPVRIPPMPALCPICGRKPKVIGYVIRCRQFSQTREHVLKVESNTNLYPVAAWNSYVRRIQGRK